MNVGNTQQNIASLLAAAIIQANGSVVGTGVSNNARWATWRVGSVSRTSGAGLLIQVPLVPGFTPPAGTNDAEAS